MFNLSYIIMNLLLLKLFFFFKTQLHNSIMLVISVGCNGLFLTSKQVKMTLAFSEIGTDCVVFTQKSGEFKEPRLSGLL